MGLEFMKELWNTLNNLGNMSLEQLREYEEERRNAEKVPVHSGNPTGDRARYSTHDRSRTGGAGDMATGEGSTNRSSGPGGQRPSSQRTRLGPTPSNKTTIVSGGVATEIALQKYNEYLDKAAEVEGKGQNTFACNTANVKAQASGQMSGSWKSGGTTYHWSIHKKKLQNGKCRCFIRAHTTETKVSTRFRYILFEGPVFYEYTQSEDVLKIGDCVATNRSDTFDCKK